MISSLFLLLVVSFLSLWLSQFRVLRSALAAVPAALFVYFLNQLQGLSPGQYFFETVPLWSAFPEFTLNFRADALSLYLSLIVTFIGSGIALYASQYFTEAKKAARFFSLFFLFMLAMLGVVFSDNFLGLFVFWETTSISSYLLIAFYYEQQNSRDSALQALLVTGAGGLAMLAGILLLGNTLGTFELTQLVEISAQMGKSFGEDPKIVGSLLLIFLGALTKSAQFPFHFWLPNAMTAPTPASSYLHSATMVKAGVFLLLRLFPIFSSLDLWKQLLTPVGGITFSLAAFLALFQVDLKKYLAYTTVAALGILTFFIGHGSDTALYAVLLFIPAHALYKAPLFLLVGNIEHATQTRDLRKIHALFSRLKGSFFAVLLCAFSLAGLPPFFSFVAKELMLKDLYSFSFLYLIFFVFAAGVFVYLALLLVFKVFLNKNSELPEFKKAHESPFLMVLSPLLMGVSALGISLFPQVFEWLKIEEILLYLNPQFKGVPEYHLFHGVNKELLTSVVAVLLGGILYKTAGRKIPKLYEFGVSRLAHGPTFLYHFLLENVLLGAKAFFSKIQNGRLNIYLIVVVLFALFLLVLPLRGEFVLEKVSFNLGGIKLFEVILSTAMVAGALMALRAQSNLSALTSLGVVGFGIAFMFLVNGAPDLALTQFLVESLTLILLVLIFRHLPKTPMKSHPAYTFFTGFIAVAFGLIFGFMTFLASQDQARAQIRNYFSANSYLQAFGKNVVNVILVDFRGIDTMGEILVLCLAAVGVLSLLNWKSSAKEES